jgi:hypothetical protein
MVKLKAIRFIQIMAYIVGSSELQAQFW